jgi:ABC-type lipoprotein export system ATPase subunit
VDGADVTGWSDAARARVRRLRLGFVRQAPSENLIEYLTVRQHLRLGAKMRGAARSGAYVDDYLSKVDLLARADNLPHQLSGGEQQRTAIAFAAIGAPSVLIADEPTGQLDHRRAADVLALFERLRADGMAVVFATHDPAVWATANRVIRIETLTFTGKSAPDDYTAD